MPAKSEEPAGDASKEGGIMKRIIPLAATVAIMAALVMASSFSVTAQQSDLSAPEAGQGSATEYAPICAPWSKAWYISEGWWYFEWYRWCYDPANSDPSDEGSWYQQLGDREWSEQVNLCPDRGSCTMSRGPGGNVQMSSHTS